MTSQNHDTQTHTFRKRYTCVDLNTYQVSLSVLQTMMARDRTTIAPTTAVTRASDCIPNSLSEDQTTQGKVSSPFVSRLHTSSNREIRRGCCDLLVIDSIQSTLVPPISKHNVQSGRRPVKAFERFFNHLGQVTFSSRQQRPRSIQGSSRSTQNCTASL